MTYGARAIAAAREHLTTGKCVKDITAETGLLQGAVSNGMMVLRFTPELVDLVWFTRGPVFVFHNPLIRTVAY